MDKVDSSGAENLYRRLPKSLTTVTTFSKLIALILFILLPFAGFMIGMRYQSKLDESKSQQSKAVDVTPAPTAESTPALTFGPIDTSTWKIYRNNRYNFIVNYPPNLEADEQTNPPSVLFNPKSDIEGAPGVPIFYISVVENPPIPNEYPYNRFSQEEISSILYSKIGENININPYSLIGGVFKHISNVQISGLLGIMIDNSKAKDRRILIKKESSTYIIGSYYTSEESLKNFKEFYSSFKFLDSNVASTPSPTCIPRPACLDSTPRCMIAEPAEGWCP